MQASLFTPPAREHVLRNFDLWLGAHLCNFGRGIVPRYPLATEVYRVEHARQIVLNIHGSQFVPGGLHGTITTLFELSYRMTRAGDWVLLETARQFNSSRSVQGWRWWRNIHGMLEIDREGSP